MSWRAVMAGVSSMALAAVTAQAQTPTVAPLPFATTVAGLAAGSGNTQCSTDIVNNYGAHLGDGCLPTQATLASVYGAFTDAVGNVYISENGTDNDIRVIYKGGAALTQLLVASSANLTSFTPTPGRIYTLAGALPSTLTVKNGSKYSCNGQTTGPQAIDSAGDGCPGTQAYIKPRGLFVDANGNVFFVSTGGGNTSKVLYAGGTQVANLIVAENPGVVPQVGFVYKLAGQSTASFNGDGAIASASALIVVRDTVVDTFGNIYVSDGNSSSTSGNNVRVIYGGVQAPAGIANPTLGFIYTYAGAAGCAAGATACTAGDSGDGGAATAATLSGPYTMFLDRFNNLFVSEYSGNRLRVIYNSGTIAGLAGLTAGSIYTYTGTGALQTDNTVAQQVKFNSVQVAGVDGGGNIYVEDATTKNIWRFDALTANGYVIGGRSAGSAPLAGVNCNGMAGPGPSSLDNYGDGCPATQASFSDIGRISFDGQGNAYIGENGNAIVRRLSYNTQFPNTNAAASTTQPLAFKALSAVTLASESFAVQGATSAVYSDAGTDTCTATAALAAAQVCVFNVSFTPPHDGLWPGTVTLTAASNAVTEFLSGVGVAADLAIDPATQTAIGAGFKPGGVAVDNFGNLFVADQTNGRVLKGTLSSTTLATFATGGLSAPTQVSVDSQGNVLVADTGNNRVVKFLASGTLQGTVGAGLSAPRGVAADAFGNTWVADTGNHRVVEIASNGVQTVVAALSGLSAPAQMWFDAAGDLFVVDTGLAQVIELPVNGSQTALALGAVTPTAVAVDASGTVYVADSATKQVQAFAPGATVGNPLLTGTTSAIGLAVDLDGDLVVADTGATSVALLNRQLANITFPITNVNQASTSSINLTNSGNAALSFTGATLYTLTGSPEFSLAPSTTNGCGAGVNYAAGSGCNFTATFLPTATGAASAKAKFNTNATNTGTAAAQLSGTGQQLVATSTTIAVTSPTGTISYGQTVTLSATVTPAANSGTPTGTVMFTVDGRAQTPVAYGSGTVPLTLTSLAVGTHLVSVAYSGDGVYASSAATTSFSVVKAATATALTVTPINANGTVTLTFAASVASATATGETGSVAFYAGTQLLSTQPLSTGRTATYSTSTVSFAVNTFTAVYSGDANFAGSTSPAIMLSNDFAIGTSASSGTIPQGGTLDITFVVAALYGTTGTITPSCSGLPVNTVCRFQPVTIPVSGTSNVQVLIYTNVNASLNAQNTSGRNAIWLAGILPVTLLLFGARSRRLRWTALAALLPVLAAMPLSGCGSSPSAAQANAGYVTPTGTSAVTFTFAGAAPLTTHTATFSLTVTPNTTGF